MLTKYQINAFVDNPLGILCDIIETLDDSCKSALTAVFLRGGQLPSPMTITEEEKFAIERVGGTIGETRKGLEDLDGSLLLNSIQDGRHYWHFKHPTIRDAFANTVASSVDLMDIYLTGAPLDKLFKEVTCGDLGITGVAVIVPVDQYHIVLEKIKKYDTSKWYNKMVLYKFLSYRCDKAFLSEYIEIFPDIISKLSISSYIYANSDVDLLVRFHEFDLLPENYRIEAVKAIKALAIEVPDSGFLSSDIRGLITSAELSEILDSVKNELLPFLSQKIDTWKYNYNSEEDPELYFDELKSTFGDYREEFQNDSKAVNHISKALSDIDEVIEELKDDYSPKDGESWWTSKADANETANSRSIFDDVDQ